MIACPDDVQRFGRAIAAGKPFESEGTSRRVSKRGDGNKDGQPDDGSDQESESASEHQQPVVVSRLMECVSILISLKRVRTTRGGASWLSFRTRARTTTDSCILFAALCCEHDTPRACTRPPIFYFIASSRMALMHEFYHIVTSYVM